LGVSSLIACSAFSQHASEKTTRSELQLIDLRFLRFLS